MRAVFFVWMTCHMMARLAFGMSVMNMWPGAWVIMNSGLTAMATACG